MLCDFSTVLLTEVCLITPPQRQVTGAACCSLTRLTDGGLSVAVRFDGGPNRGGESMTVTPIAVAAAWSLWPPGSNAEETAGGRVDSVPAQTREPAG